MTIKLGIASGDRIPRHRSPDNKPHWGGSGWVRLGQYAPHLTDHDFEVVIGTLVWNRTHFCINPSEEVGGEMIDIEIVYMQRLMHDTLANHIRMAQATGQIIVNDLDDWYWGLHPSNSAWISSHPKESPSENINHYKSVLNASDYVTVSTPYLADRISSFVHCPIVVLQNTVDTARFSPVKHQHTIPTVGWVGSTNHRSNDLEILAGIIKPLYNDNQIVLMHAGHHYGAPTVASKWGVPEESVETLSAVDPEQYPSLLTMEIGIAPLNDTPFNHAKSDIKVLEYSASGIPWVASDLPSYRNLAKEWGVGRVAKKATQWIKHLKALKDPDVRIAEASVLLEKVKQRDIEIGARTFAEFLKSLSF